MARKQTPPPLLSVIYIAAFLPAPIEKRPPRPRRKKLPASGEWFKQQAINTRERRKREAAERKRDDHHRP